MHMHHVSIRTADIFKAIAFYEQLGFAVETRFTTGTTLACWMTRPNGDRLELILIPQPTPAPDCFHDPHYVGYYHLSFLVDSVPDTLTQLGSVSLLLPPTQQTIGDRTYTVAFVADPDGLPIELLSPSNSPAASSHTEG